MVSQDPVLFPISIEDNVRLGKENATTEEIIQACQMANIHEFIMSKLDQVNCYSFAQLSIFSQYVELRYHRQ